MFQGQAFEAQAFSRGQIPVIIIGQGGMPSTAARNTVNGPGSLAFDRAGNLWVVDGSNDRVLKFDHPFSRNMSASLVIGQRDFVTGGRMNFFSYSYSVGPNVLDHPNTIAFDTDANLWVTDYFYSRVLEFKHPFTNGMNASKVIGEPNFFDIFWLHNPNVDAARNRFAGPSGLAFDRSGNLWVADVNYNRVLEFKPPFTNGMDASLVIGEPNFNTGMCQPYQGGYACPENDPGPAHIRNPGAVAFDGSGNLWVTDTGSLAGGRILEFKPPFSNGMNASLVSNIPANSLAFDRDGNLWGGVSWWRTQLEGRVLEFHPPFSDHMNASLLMGSDYSGDPRTLLFPTLMRPVALVFDSAGNLWVSDFEGEGYCSGGRCYGGYGRILGFDPQTHSVRTLSGEVQFENDEGLMVPLSSIPVTQVGALTFPEGLFNFTIQGLPVDSSVTVTITFPHALPVGIGWWSNSSGASTIFTQISGNNITLTLINASENGVISVFGGPAVIPTGITSSTEIVTTSSPQSQTLPPNVALGVPLAIIIVAAVAITLFWKKKPK